MAESHPVARVQAKYTVCKDMRALVNTVAPTFDSYMTVDRAASNALGRRVEVVMSDAYAMEATSPAYWALNSPSMFLSYSWLMDDMLRQHNEQFFYLTPQNLRICNDVWVGMVQFRLGQHEDWPYMGMTTIICDAAAKIRLPASGFGAGADPDGLPSTKKIPSAGLDLDVEVLDMRRTSYRSYLKGWAQQDDDQKFAQLRRTSEAALQMGYVMFVNGDVETMPDTELATDIVLSEVSWPALSFADAAHQIMHTYAHTPT